MGRYSRNHAWLTKVFIIGIVAGGILLGGCTRVQPWDRQYLANPYMAIDPQPLKSKLRQHIYSSREAASGGYGVGGGGCGCN